MKRFFSALLAVVLIVASLATVASAVQVQPGETRDFTVTVSGDEFANYGVRLSADAGVTIVKVSGATYGGGVAAWASATNVTSHSFTVTVKIADDLAPGTYNVYASVIHATKDVGIDNDTDSIKDGFMAASVSANGASFVIEAPKCDHDWGKGVVTTPATCTENGVMTFTCSKCGETKTEVIPAAHSWKAVWSHDAAHHWHECSVCGEKADMDKHDWRLIDQLIPTPEMDGYTKLQCRICDRTKTEEWMYGEEPKVGDIRPMILMGAVATVTALAAVSYVFKRKNVI